MIKREQEWEGLWGLFGPVITFGLSQLVDSFKLAQKLNLNLTPTPPLVFAFLITLTPMIAAIIGYLLFRFIANFYNVNKVNLTSHIALPWKLGVIVTWIIGTAGFVGLWGGMLNPNLFSLSATRDYFNLIYVLVVGFVITYLAGSSFYWFISRVLFLIPIFKISPSPKYRFLLFWGVGKTLVPFGVRRKA